MRKRNAIIVGSAFLLITAGYVAWCYQHSYMRRPFHYAANIPPEVVAMAEQYRKTDPGLALDRAGWSLRDISYTLSNPYRPLRYPIHVDYRGDTEIAVAVKGGCHLMVCFKKEGGSWKGYDFFGKPLNIAPQQ